MKGSVKRRRKKSELRKQRSERVKRRRKKSELRRRSSERKPSRVLGGKRFWPLPPPPEDCRHRTCWRVSVQTRDTATRRKLPDTFGITGTRPGDRGLKRSAVVRRARCLMVHAERGRRSNGVTRACPVLVLASTTMQNAPQKRSATRMNKAGRRFTRLQLPDVAAFLLNHLRETTGQMYRCSFLILFCCTVHRRHIARAC